MAAAAAIEAAVAVAVATGGNPTSLSRIARASDPASLALFVPVGGVAPARPVVRLMSRWRASRCLSTEMEPSDESAV